MAFIRKRRIWWEPVSEASSYVVYVNKDSSIFEPDRFSWKTTPEITFKQVNDRTELIIPDEWPEFPQGIGKLSYWDYFQR